MNVVYLGLGANLGDKRKCLTAALDCIEQLIGRIVSRSAFYDTMPWGFVSDSRFLNAVAKVETRLSPDDVLRVTQQIEKKLGRREKSCASGYTDRPIDIDILFFNNDIIQEKNLQVPHPLIEKRDFVLLPMVEIAPDFQHPVTHESMRTLLQTLLKNNP